MDVLLRLGSECNQKCVFCNVEYCDRLSTKEAIKEIKGIRNKIQTLSITGGEPTLRKDLPTIIKEASNNRNIKNANLQTNAAVISYKDYANMLREAGLDKAFVAFHSHNEQTSNILTKSNLWRKTVEGIKNLSKAGIEVTLNPVINKLNYKILPGYVKFVRKEFPEVKRISFSFIQPIGRAWKNKGLVPKYSEVFPYLEKTITLCKENKIGFFNPYCGSPLCFFPADPKTSNEYLDEALKTREERDSAKRVKAHKVKSDACVKCKQNKKCNGVWIEYAKIHGTSELRPIN